MIREKGILRYISRKGLILSILFALTTTSGFAMDKVLTEKKDSIALFKGFQVYTDLLGMGKRFLKFPKQYEVGARLNLEQKFFPAIEVGYAQVDSKGETTCTHYKSQAPYGKIGLDYNVLKSKQSHYRLLAGMRYAFCKYRYDIYNEQLQDPIWLDKGIYEVKDAQGDCHWTELQLCTDVKLWGPIHIGWSVKYQLKLFEHNQNTEKAWYIPGYGKRESGHFGGTFNLIIDI